MPDWDRDSPQLRRNLKQLLTEIRDHAFARKPLQLDDARHWHCVIMQGLRYHLPPFVRLRPRPNFGYEAAAGEAMLGNRKPTTTAFRRMLDAFLGASQ